MSYRRYWSRSKPQEFFDGSLNLLWIAPLILGFVLLIGSINQGIHVQNDTDDWIEAAQVAPTAGDMEMRLSQAITGMEEHELVTGNGALFAENISDDYNRIYRDLMSYRDQAAELSATGDANTDDYQMSMISLREKLAIVSPSFGYSWYFDSWANFTWLLAFIAIAPMVLVKNQTDKFVDNRRYERSRVKPNGQTIS